MKCLHSSLTSRKKERKNTHAKQCILKVMEDSDLNTCEMECYSTILSIKEAGKFSTLCSVNFFVINLLLLHNLFPAAQINVTQFLSCSAHVIVVSQGWGFIIKLRNWSTWENTNPWEYPRQRVTNLVVLKPSDSFCGVLSQSFRRGSIVASSSCSVSVAVPG